MEPNIAYDVANLKRLIHIEEGQPKKGKIVVVGDGISAADAINLCLKNELPVVHVMRRSDAQLRRKRIKLCYNLIFFISFSFQKQCYQN